MKAIRIYEPGGPETLHYEEVSTPKPSAGEVRVKIAAAGINFIDIYHRAGLYPLDMPVTPGLEGAGTIDAVGEDVSQFKIGDRVAFSSQMGAYADYLIVPVAKLVPVPDGVDLAAAAAIMLQGMTAHYLALDTYPLEPGDTAFVHAAAGGVGLLLTQIAKRQGATVIGTVSTPEKAKLARQAGADHVILYTQTDFETETMQITDGQGVNVVYDSVGVDTFEKSLNILRPRGYLALFGQSSGPVPPVDLQILNAKGSLFVTRPTLFHYIASRAELLRRSGDLFAWLKTGDLSVRIDRQLPLRDAAEAHRLLADRKTAGKLLLVP